MVADKNSKDDLWLVKSGDKILGPFSTKEVADRLRTRDIVIIDEAASAQSRWRYLRDQPAFSAVVEEVRKNQMNSREDTEVQGHTHTPTQTISMMTAPNLSAPASSGSVSSAAPSSETVTVTPTPLVISRTSPQPSSRGSRDYDPKNIRDAEFTEELHDFSDQGASQSTQSDQVRQYGYGESAQVRRGIHRSSRLLWLIAVLLVVGVGGFLAHLFRPQVSQPVASPNLHESFKRDFIDAESAWNNGQWDLALNLYREADQIIPGTPDVVVHLAPLMMKLEGQTVAAKRALQDLTERTADSGAQMEAKLGLGLAALMSEDSAEAEKIFSQILALNPNQVIAQFNLGMLKYVHSDYKAAVGRFSEAVRIDPEMSVAHLMLALSYMGSGSISNAEFKAAKDELDGFISKTSDFRQEAQILATWLMTEKGNRLQASVAAQMALDTDPYLTAEHFHDPRLYLDTLFTGPVATVCKNINSKLKNTLSQALYGICLMNAEQRAEAEHILSDALSMAPADPHLLAANAYFLMRSGRAPDAKATLAMVSKDSGSQLTTILTARNCATLQDEECALPLWTELASKEPVSLAALVELAKAAEAKRDLELSKKLLLRAETLSPRYLPAIRLRQKVSGP